MATNARSIAWGRVALQGLLAGLAGAVLHDAAVWLALVLPSHGSMPALWSAVAATALGKGAAAGTDAAAVGLAIDLAVSLVWGFAYAYLAATQPALNRRWPISGLAYGLAVYIMMQIVLLVSGNFEYPHTPNDFVAALLAHVVFFGLPVAAVVRALDRSQ